MIIFFVCGLKRSSTQLLGSCIYWKLFMVKHRGSYTKLARNWLNWTDLSVLTIIQDTLCLCWRLVLKLAAYIGRCWCRCWGLVYQTREISLPAWRVGYLEMRTKSVERSRLITIHYFLNFYWRLHLYKELHLTALQHSLEWKPEAFRDSFVYFL